MGCHFPLQGLFLTQGSNLGLLPCRQILYHLRHQGRPQVAEVHIKGMISVSLDPCIFPWGASRVALVVKNLPAYAILGPSSSVQSNTGPSQTTCSSHNMLLPKQLHLLKEQSTLPPFLSSGALSPTSPPRGHPQGHQRPPLSQV